MATPPRGRRVEPPAAELRRHPRRARHRLRPRVDVLRALGPGGAAPLISAVEGTYTWRPSAGHVGQDGAFSAVAERRTPAAERSSPKARRSSATTRRSRPTMRRRGPRRPSAATADASSALTRTVGEWPPVWRVATHSPLDYQGLAAIVRTAVEDGDEAVGIKPLKDGDRAVWRAAMTLGGKLLELVVDQQTGIVTWYSDGEDTFTAKVDWDVAAAGRHDLHGRRAGGDGGRRRSRTRRPTRSPRRRRAAPPATTRSSPTWRRTATSSRPSPPSPTATGPWAGSRQPAERRPGLAAARAAVVGSSTRAVSAGSRGADRAQGTGVLRREPGDWPADGLAPTGSRSSRRRCSTERSRARRPPPGTRRLGRRCSRRSAPGGVRHRRAHPPGADRVR